MALPLPALQIMGYAYQQQRPELISLACRIGEQLALPGAGNALTGAQGTPWCPGMRAHSCGEGPYTLPASPPLLAPSLPSHRPPCCPPCL